MNQNYPNIPFVNAQNKLGFEIVRLEKFLKYGAKQVIELIHRPSFYCIILITHGNGEHIINFQTFQYQQGSLIFIAKNQLHAFKINKNAQGFVLMFDEDFLNRNQLRFSDLSYSYPFNFDIYQPVIETGTQYDSFATYFDYVFREYQEPVNNHTDEILQCLLRALLLKIKMLSSPSRNRMLSLDKKSKNTFIQFQQLLEKYYESNRNASFYCDQLSVSFKTLNNICKELTGKTIKKFIDEILSLKAKQYLTVDNNNISEVSYRLGFDETTNFTKFFRKHTSMSPSEFQKNMFDSKNG
jgi:AraC family transcriptional regulator, transcriptional activator of pobA